CPTTETKYVVRFFEELRLKIALSKIVISDRGTAFTSQAFERYCQENGIQHVKCSTQHPEANGAVERVNRILASSFAIHTEKPSGSDWAKKLLQVQHDLNAVPHKSTGKSPFFVLYGFLPEHPGNSSVEELVEKNNENPVKSLEELRKEVNVEIEKSRKVFKRNFEKRHVAVHNYSVGDVVVVRRLPEATGQPTKFQPKYRGPFVVTKVL